ncbi:Tellurium resistance protein [Desulfamplus magnetovallimortis]|uniref:Tellurium resistance protein n=1 Tax=Desulfamplus magnetovallimortis TaxID=1246637 RepID=A0A1W1HAG5_9BACT|nr:TerY-C metal binding domain-containing protein [Desulfamplus magnetovallimortis]SLM29412.1 Tellurium resistance protein [Desulfamplus magnetovallimortis]
MRRLPVFLLLDVSDSMIGEPLQYLEKGLDTLISKLRQDPNAIETVFLSIIAFAGKVKTLVPLMDLPSFYPPRLQVGAGTALGLAIEHLMKEIDKNVVKTTRDRKGDWKPLVYLMTDGKPTDKCDSAIEKWKRHYSVRVNLIAIGLGPHASTETFLKFADHVLSYNGENETDFARFIEWMTMSVRSQSIKVMDSSNEDSFKVSLEKAGNVIELAKFRPSPDDDHVILVGRCQTRHTPYLIKFDRMNYPPPFRRNQLYPSEHSAITYIISGCFPVDESYFEWSGSCADIDPKVSISSLYGSASCPCCGNPIANGFCGCGKMFCISGTGPALCPWCGREAIMEVMEDGADLEIARSRG